MRQPWVDVSVRIGRYETTSLISYYDLRCFRKSFLI